MNERLLKQIRELSHQYKSEFIAIRRYLHQHPELSYHEFETSKFVRNKLAEYGIPCVIMAQTGVVGLIKGRNPDSSVVALRADMDALPIDEANDVPYKSVNSGVMHACGHDVHTTVLLGAAKILSKLRNDWEGTIKLIFQPGEEKNPGGASLMIKEGVLKNPAPAAIFGLHTHPGLSVGKFSFRGGKSMASADELYITVRGKGGHASQPQKTGDTVLCASQIVVALQQVISRRNDPFNPSVLSICAINGGNATNVLPTEVKMAGTFRALDEAWRFSAHDLIRRICKDTADSFGLEVETVIDVGYPFLLNDEKLTAQSVVKAAEFAGKENIEETEVRMGAEDFAYYSHKIPACFYRLGVRNETLNIISGAHTPTFNVDENAIEPGMGMMAWLGSTYEIS